MKAGETERDKMAGALEDKMAGALEEKEEKEEDKGERNNEKRGGRGEKDGNKKRRMRSWRRRVNQTPFSGHIP